MSDIFGFDNTTFLSLASLLSVCQGSQEIAEYTTINEVPDHDEWESETENDSTIMHQLSGSTSKDQVLAKFLDHIAETFSQAKSIPRHERRRSKATINGAIHVTASGLVFDHGDPIVYVAKNGIGSDSIEDSKRMKIDEELANSLTKWMRIIASTMKRPAIDKDQMWTKLISYYKQRLHIYISHIKGSSKDDLAAAFNMRSDGIVLAKELHELSAQYKADSIPLEVLKRMISIAYQLRPVAAPVGLTSHIGRIRRSVFFLGRLRSAYETFKETAIELQKSFKTITISCLPPPDARWLKKSQLIQRVQELVKMEQVPQPQKHHLDKLRGRPTNLLTTCHAEVQLLLKFEGSFSTNTDPFPYIGCSRMSCWLCYQLLAHYKDKRTDTRGYYQTRGSHGTVYPFWHIALGSDSVSYPRVQFNLSVALQDIQVLMQQQLKDFLRTQRPKRAESSTNVTVAGGALKHSALTRMREAESWTTPGGTEGEVGCLKELVCSRQCIRFPATGEPAHCRMIDFYRCPTDYPGTEPVTFCIPDLSTYWGKSNFDRAHRQILIKDQDLAELNGDYLFYWCRKDDLPPNKYLMNLLRIDSVPFEEYFWYGDVFITKFHEDEGSFRFDCEDVPEAFLSLEHLIENMIRSEWERKTPEDEIRRWQYFDTKQEKRNADKQVILERM
jgi:hypothetical protein